MTIAACYVSGEGVVLGADSSTTVLVADPETPVDRSEHHFEHAQKVFEIGENSTLGIVTWGMGNLGDVSYRTLVALFSDDLRRSPAGTMLEVAERWNTFYWGAYIREMQATLQRVQHLLGLGQPTEGEQAELVQLREGLSGGFCLGGYLLPDRTPKAFEVLYEPTLTSPRAVLEVSPGTPPFWGTANVIDRLVTGIDGRVIRAIARSGHWTGTLVDLVTLVTPFSFGHPLQLPIREALDWIHSSLYTTIKALKFSHHSPTCGGAIELAVITSDRLFRWVRHKRLDSAIDLEGAFDG